MLRVASHDTDCHFVLGQPLLIAHCVYSSAH